MADTLALEKLYADVVARFTADGDSAEFTFGWREPPRQLKSTRRVIFRPGDDSGRLGELGAPRNPGRNPRPLGTLHEIVTIYILAQDPSSPDDELKQWKATRLLFDAVARAVYLAAHGTYEVLDTRWEAEKTERRFGAGIALILAVESMIPDTQQSTAPTDAHADLTDTIPTDGETFTVNPTDTP